MSVSPLTFNVITNCTSRKSSKTPAVQLPWPEHPTSLDHLCSTWWTALQRAEPIHTAAALYNGRSFSDAKAVTATLEADLYVVSAGLGLIHGDATVPHYNLTVSAGVGSIAPLLKSGGYTAKDWWQALCKAQQVDRPVKSLVERDPTYTTLIALPASYLAMISDELDALADSTLHRVRIFTSPAGSKALSRRLSAVCMPYDGRIESLASHAGTQADFPQRALRHFVDCLQGQNMCLTEAKESVSHLMAKLTQPQLPPRVRRSDGEIMTLLTSNWSRFNGHQAPLLRYLRDEALVSCEQGRFSALWRQAKGQLNMQ